MTFGHLHLLYLLLLVPVLVVAYAFDGQRRRRVLERIGHLPMLRRMIASSSPGARRWRAILTVSAVAFLCAMLARPQIPGRAKLTETRGLDLVVALDFSRSMLAKDVYPTRLDRAKRELEHLIDTLKGDRVGLVAFAGETLSYPLTIDYEAAKLFWRDLGPDDMPVGGTDLGRAVRASIELLTRGKKATDKRQGAQVILLLTDGEDTEGQGQAAAKEAAALGIRLYTLGIGSSERPFIQLTDNEGKSAGYLTGPDGEPVRVGLDEGALRQMAAATGGEYVALDPRRFGVDRVEEAISGLERKQEEARLEHEPDDVGRWFLLPAFILLLTEAAIGERRRARVKVEAAQTSSPINLQKAALVFVVLFPFVTGFDLFLRRDPNVEDGNKKLAAGKAEDALKAYDDAAGVLPDEPIVRFDRGAALYQLGKFPEAQKEFQHATESHDPALKADAYYNMGNSLMKQERFKDALDAYKHTLVLRPEDRRAKWNLELALRRMKEQQQKQQQQQQQQNQDQKDQKDQKDQQKQSQQDQQKQDPKKQEQQKQDQQKQDQQKQAEQKQQEQQKQAEQQKQEQQKQAEQKQGDKPKPDEQKAAAVKREPPREIDKQDAEAVLDALERVEPTVQKELARRRAGNRRPVKDW